MRLLLVFLSAVTLSAQSVQVQFNPADPATGPFPTNYFTLADPAQKTGLRVALPVDNCQSPTGDCAELNLLNQLDGFHLQPRITVKFTAGINPDTLRDGIFLVWMETAWSRPFELGSAGKITPVNQLQWDPTTNTAYAKPDQPLEQGRLYAVLVTNGVKDWNGQSVTASDGFTACTAGAVTTPYCLDLRRALQTAPAFRVVGGSVFTTLSATSWLESAAAATRSAPPDFQRTAAAPVLNAADVRSFTWRQQISASPSGDLFDYAIPITGDILTQGGVGRIAFGSFKSPRFLVAPGIIPQTPTASPVTMPAQSDEIFFHVFLPSAPPPPGGYPVLLAGHGLGDSRFGIPFVMALSFAKQGYAVVAMTAYGHGFGPRSVLRVTTASSILDIPAPGRASDVDGDGSYASFEGCVMLQPGTPAGIRDCLRQTALDYTALIRALRTGIDFDGDGRPDLNGHNLAYYGQSLGSYYGSLLTAIEPALPVSVLNVGGGSAVEAGHWSPTIRLLLTFYMLRRRPLLLNAGLGFDDQYPSRYQPVQVFNVPGAPAIGEVLDRLEWLEAQGAPFAFAPLFKSATPAGQFIKRVLFQIAQGDQTVPNPANSLLIRAANLRENTVLYRHDLARAAAPELSANPHGYLAWFISDGTARAIAIASLTQAQIFIASGAEIVPDVDSAMRAYFEIPAFLPETPNFVP
jgi:hypothetical protein